MPILQEVRGDRIDPHSSKYRENHYANSSRFLSILCKDDKSGGKRGRKQTQTSGGVVPIPLESTTLEISILVDYRT